MALPHPGLALSPLHLASRGFEDAQLAAFQHIPAETGVSCRARHRTNSSLQPKIMHQPNDEEEQSPLSQGSQRRGTQVGGCLSISGDFTPGTSEALALESMAQSLSGRSHTTWSHLGASARCMLLLTLKLFLVKIMAALSCSALPREKMMFVTGSGVFLACFVLCSCSLGSRIAD